MAGLSTIKVNLDATIELAEIALETLRGWDNLEDKSELECTIEDAMEYLARALQGAENAWEEAEAEE